MADKVVVFIGPRCGFEYILAERISKYDYRVSLLEAVRIYNARVRASDLSSQAPKTPLPDQVDVCVAYADDYGSVLSHAIAGFATILEETFEIGTLYVQNPPRRALQSLIAAHDEDDVEIVSYEYPKVGKTNLPEIIERLKREVLGQEASKKALLSSLYRLSVMGDDRPSVLLMYGPSGMGKTETARCVSEAVGGNLTRVQFSMMQTQEAYEYLFGSEHSKASFARDLLGRESNVVLIDEFDKVTPSLYNMFYQLFDEGCYIDTNYNVDMRNALFLLTSNFSSKREARRAMGSAMFSRISECVAFEDLTLECKQDIAQAEYQKVLEKLEDEDRAVIEASDISEWFRANAGRYDNMRIMKNKVDKAIFEKLSAPFLA